MKKLPFLLLATFITLFFACSTDDSNLIRQFQLDQPFQLNFEDHAVCTCDDDFSIRFTDVLEDSICPPDVDCIWEGGVRVETTVDLPEKTIVELFRGAILQKEYIGQIDTVGNYIINIINAEREEVERGNPAAYTIELLVTEL